MSDKLPLHPGAFFLARSSFDSPPLPTRAPALACPQDERKRHMMRRTQAALAQTQSRLARTTRSLERSPGTLAPVAL